MHHSTARLLAKAQMPQQQITSQPPRKGRPRRPARRMVSQRTIIIGFALVCVLALAVFAIRTGSRPALTAIDRADVTNVQLVAQGKLIYATRCAACHGGDLQGEPGWPTPRPNNVMPASPLDARGTTWQRTDQWLFTTIKQGGQATASPGATSLMPAFGGGLTDAEIWAVISYLKSSWPEDTQTAQPQR